VKRAFFGDDMRGTSVDKTAGGVDEDFWPCREKGFDGRPIEVGSVKAVVDSAKDSGRRVADGFQKRGRVVQISRDRLNFITR